MFLVMIIVGLCTWRWSTIWIWAAGVALVSFALGALMGGPESGLLSAIINGVLAAAVGAAVMAVKMAWHDRKRPKRSVAAQADPIDTPKV